MTACPSCSSNDLVCVSLSLGVAPVLFSHCRNCEYRWWADQDSGEVVDLGELLAVAS